MIVLFELKDKDVFIYENVKHFFKKGDYYFVEHNDKEYCTVFHCEKIVNFDTKILPTKGDAK